MNGTSAAPEKHRLRPSPPLITLNILNLPASPVKYSHTVTQKLPCDERRRRVKKEDAMKIQGLSGIEGEKWRVQAEGLRDECNLLKMEGQFALKKLEKNRVNLVKKTLKSDGKNRIFEEALLEKETEDLKQKLEELQKISSNKVEGVHRSNNFDKKAFILQHKLEELSKKQLPEGRFFEEVTLFSNPKPEILLIDEFDKERSSILSRVTSISASNLKGFEAVDCSRQVVQDRMVPENGCSGRCMALVRKIFEQLISETEQWSQIQGMLDRVRGEMEQLQLSRDYWENRAHNSIKEVQLLRLLVDQWRGRALCNENKAKRLQLELKSKKLDQTQRMRHLKVFLS